MNWKNKRVLVTGGGGFLGRYIVERLLELKCSEVRSLGRSPQPELQATGVTVFSGDIADKNTVMAASENCDIIFHTAAKAGIWGSYKEFYTANVTGTENIIKACHENKIPYLINTSTPSVVCKNHNIENGTEILPYPESYPAYYPETKAEAEKMVSEAASSDLKTVSIRPHLLWGVRDSHILPTLAKRAHQRRLMQVGDGKSIVDMTHIKNATEAHIKAAEALHSTPEISGRKYFISDDNPLNLWDWIKNFLKEIDAPPIQKNISFKRAYKIGSIMEFIFKMLHIKHEPPMTRFAAIQLAHSHYFDITAAKNELNYTPIINYDQAYRETIEWMKRKNI